MFDIAIITNASQLSQRFLNGSRNGLFFAFPMLVFGTIIRTCTTKKERNNKILLAFFIASLLLSFFEAAFLKVNLGTEITNDLTFLGWVPALPLFLLSIQTTSRIRPESLRKLRKIVDVVYIVHVWIIILVEKLLNQQYILKFVFSTIISFALAAVIVLLLNSAEELH